MMHLLKLLVCLLVAMASGCSNLPVVTLDPRGGHDRVFATAPPGWIQRRSDPRNESIELILRSEPKIYPRPTIYISRSKLRYRFPRYAPKEVKEQLAPDQYLKGMRDLGYTNMGLSSEGEYTAKDGLAYRIYIEASNGLYFITFVARGEQIYTVSLAADRSELFSYYRDFLHVLDSLQFHPRKAEVMDANLPFAPQPPSNATH